MRACFSGSALEAFDVQIYSFVIPALAAAWGMTKAQASYWSTVALFPRTGRCADGHAERPDRLLGRARRPHAAMQLALIDPEGRLLGNHRKLMRTAGEWLIRGCGEGSTLPARDAPFRRLGAIIRQENLGHVRL